MQTYKFRAECALDTTHLLHLMAENLVPFGVEVRIIQLMAKDGSADIVPDRVVTLTCPLSLDELREYTRQVPDGHVMLQTVALLTGYTGERDYDLM